MQGAKAFESEDTDRPATTSGLRLAPECLAQFTGDLAPHPVGMLIAHSIPISELDCSIELIAHIQQRQLCPSPDRIASGQLGEDGCLVDHVGTVAGNHPAWRSSTFSLVWSAANPDISAGLRVYSLPFI